MLIARCDAHAQLRSACAVVVTRLATVGMHEYLGSVAVVQIQV